MDFQKSDAQKTRWKLAVEFAEANLNSGFLERENACEFSSENWRKCAEFGIQGLNIAQQYGGKEESSVIDIALSMEGLGYGCDDLGLLFGINAQMWTVQSPITEFGSESQKERFLPRLCSGETIGADAMTEPEAGSDVFAMQTSATRCPDGYVLNGTKCMITLAPVADLVVVFAVTDPNVGKWGITAFVVETDRSGISIEGPHEKMGMRTVPMGTLRFKDCFVPIENQLGAEGAGFGISQHSLDMERCCLFASQVGMMQRQLEKAVRHAKERIQFDQPIGKNQAVSHRLADMKLRLEMARLLLYKVAWMKDQAMSTDIESAMLKLYVSEAFFESSMDAVRTFGGHGYLTKSGVEYSLRDAIGGLFYAGTSDIQRNLIANLLGL